MDAELRDKLIIRVGVLHKSTPCEAVTARLVVDTILPTIQQEIAKAKIDEWNRLISTTRSNGEQAINQATYNLAFDRIAELSQTLKELEAEL